MNDMKRDTVAARDGPTRLFDESLTLLTQVQTSLARLIREVNAGDVAALEALEPRYAELEVALKRAIEMERMVHDWKHTHGGRAAARTGHDIDFDRARHEIGCRLARLRACCDAG